MGFGQTLREAREAKGYTVAQLAEMTHIMPHTIEGFEAENFKAIAAPIYGRGFVKLCCQALGLDPKPMIDEFMSLYNGKKTTSPLTPSFAAQSPVNQAAPQPEPTPSVPVAETVPVKEEPAETPVVEPPIVEPPVSAPPPVIEPPVAEPPVSAPPPVVEPPVVEVPVSAPPPVVEPPVVEAPVSAPPPVIEPPVAEPPVSAPPPVVEAPAAVEQPTVQEPVAPEPPPAKPFHLKGTVIAEEPPVRSNYADLFSQAPSDPRNPPSAYGRFTPPVTNSDESRERVPFVMPQIPWRLILLILGALLVIWTLFVGCRAVYRMLSAPSEPEQHQIAEPTTRPAETAKPTEPPAKPAETAKPAEPVKPVEPAKPTKAVKPTKANEPARIVKPAKTDEPTPAAAKPTRTPKPVKPLYID